MAIHIYGAGMAGLLAAVMLRRHEPIVHEKQGSLPDNHGALLRFRSDRVQQETGQQFRAVRVFKALKCRHGLSDRCLLKEANQYSLKVTGEVRERSVINLSPCERFIAPADFLAVMARGLNIQFGDALSPNLLESHKAASDAVISTIPMPALMNIMGWQPRPHFGHRPIWSTIVQLAPNVNVYQTIYYPDPFVPYYRASISGRQLIIESMKNPEIDPFRMSDVLEDFGITSDFMVLEVRRQEYGKLSPVDEDLRQRFILHATDQYNVYSVGRFATWRQILLDDVADDIRKVERWIVQRSSYARRVSTL